MDKDEYQAWKDSAATQWVMRRIDQELLELAQRVSENLFNSPLKAPDQWAADQVQVAYSKGYFDGLARVLSADHESLLTEEELAALKEAEEKARN